MCGLGLFVVKAAVEVVGSVEFGVVAAGHDAPFIEDEDAVGVLNGAEAVRDGEDGAAFCEGVEGGLDLVLAFGVEGGGGFVEYDDGGVFEEGAGDCDALALSAGEPGTAFADEGFVAVIEGFDKFVGMGEAGGLADGFVVGVGVPDADVVGDGVAKEEGFL